MARRKKDPLDKKNLPPSLELLQFTAVVKLIDELTKGRFFDTVLEKEWSLIEQKALKEMKKLKETYNEVKS